MDNGWNTKANGARGDCDAHRRIRLACLNLISMFRRWLTRRLILLCLEGRNRSLHTSFNWQWQWYSRLSCRSALSAVGNCNRLADRFSLPWRDPSSFLLLRDCYHIGLQHICDRTWAADSLQAAIVMPDISLSNTVQLLACQKKKSCESMLNRPFVIMY